jgi:hypothetical protein
MRRGDTASMKLQELEATLDPIKLLRSELESLGSGPFKALVRWCGGATPISISENNRHMQQETGDVLIEQWRGLQGSDPLSKMP